MTFSEYLISPPQEKKGHKIVESNDRTMKLKASILFKIIFTT